MNYTLMNKDREVLRFETLENFFGSVYADEEGVKIINENLMPYGYKNIHGFLNGRKAPKHRENISRILQDNNGNDLNGFLRLTGGASLTDTYWVRNEDEPKSWDEVSFYRHDFDEIIGQIVFAGGRVSLKGKTTPELSTGGEYAKCWIRRDGKTYLVKRGSKDKQNRETGSEYYGSQVAEKICKNAAHYSLIEYKGYVATKCENFTSEDLGFVSIYDFAGSFPVTTPEIFAKCFSDIGDEESYRRMVVLDALILNQDRHLGNFGVLYDNENLKPVKMAPIFDLNRSMLYTKSDEEIENLDPGNFIAYPSTDGDFVSNGRKMMTDDIKSDLKNLKGFQFEYSEMGSFSKERIKKFEEFMDLQINRLLGMSRSFSMK